VDQSGRKAGLLIWSLTATIFPWTDAGRNGNVAKLMAASAVLASAP
jgi:hypothetical protein